MKEIRFRAWDRKENGMWSGEELVNAGVMLSLANGNLIHKEDPTMYLMETFKLMQFTGLKDIHGKDIYEGDIVLASMEYNGVGIAKKGEVVFEKGAFIVAGKKFTDSYMTFIELEDDFQLKVIGNIYENPELLESTDKTETLEEEK